MRLLNETSKRKPTGNHGLHTDDHAVCVWTQADNVNAVRRKYTQTHTHAQFVCNKSSELSTQKLASVCVSGADQVLALKLLTVFVSAPRRIIHWTAFGLWFSTTHFK